jgi:hypothetical protein
LKGGDRQQAAGRRWRLRPPTDTWIGRLGPRALRRAPREAARDARTARTPAGTRRRARGSAGHAVHVRRRGAGRGRGPRGLRPSR